MWILLVFLVIVLYIALFLGMWALMWWRVFGKAGRPGWASIVPIYNQIVLLEICDKPGWWIALCLIPCFGSFFAIFMHIVIGIEVAKKFGQGGGFAVGLILLPIVFFPILGFGSYEYEGRRRKRKRVYRDEDDEDEEESERPRPRRRRPIRRDDYEDDE